MKKMMTYLLLVLMACALLPFLVGLSIPKERTYTRTHLFSSSVDSVFKVVTDVKAQPEWRSELKTVEMLSPTDDQQWREVLHRGPAITFRVKRKIPNKLFEIEIVGRSLQGHWLGTFQPVDGGGTRVTFTETSIIPNPFMRTISALFVNLDETIGQYIANLQKRLGER
jgi:uncharacterized protein YndB with AHSA1/START domain